MPTLVRGPPLVRGPGPVPYTVSIGPGVSEKVPLAEFAAEVRRVLRDPRGWRKYGYDFRCRGVGARIGGVLHIRLETAAAASEACRVGGLSCWRPAAGDIVINLDNWLTAAASGLPVERYHNYVVCHEVGHALGLPHRRCPAAECARRGMGVCPASVMQQMTLGGPAVAPCAPSDWPLDPSWLVDDPRRPRAGGGAVLWLAVAVLVVLIAIACRLARIEAGAHVVQVARGTSQ